MSLAPTVAAPAALPAAAKSTSPSLFSPALDVLTLGGLSLLLVPVVLLSQVNVSSQVVMTAALIGAYLVNWPHYAATYFRAYGSVHEIRQYYHVSVVVPLVLLGIAVLAVLLPDPVAGWFYKAYLLTTGYHYSGQTYGIALIFAGKARMPITGWGKWLLAAPIYASFAVLLAHKEVAMSPAELTAAGMSPEWNFGVPVTPLGLPAWVTTASFVVFGVGLGLYLVLAGLMRARHGQALPWIVHMVVGSQVVWFVWGATNAAYFYLVPFFHCLQYLVITTYFNFRVLAARGAAPAVPKVLSFPFVRYYLGLAAVGVVLFQYLPNLLTWSGVATGGVAVAVVVAFVNLHHFLLDGAIWKLRKPDVGKVLLKG